MKQNELHKQTRARPSVHFVSCHETGRCQNTQTNCIVQEIGDNKTLQPHDSQEICARQYQPVCNLKHAVGNKLLNSNQILKQTRTHSEHVLSVLPWNFHVPETVLTHGEHGARALQSVGNLGCRRLETNLLRKDELNKKHTRMGLSTHVVLSHEIGGCRTALGHPPEMHSEHQRGPEYASGPLPTVTSDVGSQPRLHTSVTSFALSLAC